MMEFRILGRLEVLDGGRELTPRRAKQRALLAMLLLHAGEPVASEVLVEALWGERPPQTAQTALHGHVSALRKLLGADRISTRPSGYQVRVRPGELDADRFETLVRQARATDDQAERSQRLREALELWRGEPLADFRYEEFAQAEIAQLRERRLRALEDRAESELARGQHREALGELERLVAEQPLRDRLRGLLMLALYRAGRQSEALEVYQEGRQLLASELGLDPGPSLKTLHQQILEQDPALAPARSVEAIPTRQERKRVTVLVAEFAPRQPADPEELQRLVGPALGRARELVGGHGASVQLLFSNALIGVFGAARAYEDDPERAVRAAEALVDAIRAEGRLTVRVGIERGEALVTIADDRVDVTGEVVAAASRMQLTARSNGVALGPGLERATRPDSTRGEVPFVGREPELAQLERSYERAVRESAVQLVTVVGEPGSGKTRLASEFRRRLADTGPHEWLEGHCLPYGEGITFWALGEIVKARAGIFESDHPEMAAQKLAAAVAGVVSKEDGAWVEANLGPLVGLESATVANREQSFAAWRRFLERIAHNAPLVLLLEDLHWADSALVEFVDQLAGTVEGVPLLVLCTARLELLNSQPQWSGGKRNAATVTLPPLAVEETTEIVRAVLQGEEPSRVLVTRAAGNPLFAQELARMQTTAVRSIPESLEAVIAARLDALAPSAKAVAMDAAVVGEVFWPGAVAAIDGLEQRVLDDRLRQLAAADVLRPARASSIEGEREYAFLHVLVRDVAYNQIPIASRAEKHASVAAWLERLAGERVLDHAELIAHHYGAALEHARASGADTRELTDKTSEFLILAGDRSMRLDIAIAKQFYHRSLALLDHGDPRLVRVLLALARTAQETGRLEEAISRYEDAFPILEEGADPLMLGHALVNYELALWRHGRSEQRGRPLAEAIKLLERQPPGPELAEAYGLLAMRHSTAGRCSEALDWSDKAIALAGGLGLERVHVHALQYRGLSRCAVGDLGGIDDVREALRRGLEAGLGMETGTAYVNLAEMVFWIDGPGPSLDLLNQGIDFSERHGLEHNSYWLRMNKPARLFDAGRWEELLAVTDEILAWERSGGETQITTVSLVDSAGVLVLRGNVAGARSRIDRALAPAREVDDAQVLAPALVCAALVERAEGNDQTAIELLEEFEARTSDRASIYRALWIADVARTCAATGAVALANRLLTDLEVVAPRHVYGVTTARAVIAESEQRLDEALAGYSEVAQRWGDFGNVVEEGYARLGLGRCLRQRNRPGEANASLTAARAIFQALEALPLVGAVEEQLAQAVSTAG